MPTYYVEDYEEVTGKKPDGSPVKMEVAAKVAAAPEKVEAKVVTAPAKPAVKKAVARTKAVKAK
jgi:hypothetical protein